MGAVDIFFIMFFFRGGAWFAAAMLAATAEVILCVSLLFSGERGLWDIQLGSEWMDGLYRNSGRWLLFWREGSELGEWTN